METQEKMASSETDINETFLKLMGGGSAVMFVIMFSAVGQFALESIVYGAIAGIFSGTGAFLFLPWFLHVSALQSDDEDVPFSDLARQATSSTQLGVFGLGLELGGIIMLTIGFALTEVNYVLGIVGALIAAVSVYLVGSVLLDF